MTNLKVLLLAHWTAWEKLTSNNPGLSISRFKVLASKLEKVLASRLFLIRFYDYFHNAFHKSLGCSGTFYELVLSFARMFRIGLGIRSILTVAFSHAHEHLTLTKKNSTNLFHHSLLSSGWP